MLSFGLLEVHGGEQFGGMIHMILKDHLPTVNGYLT